MDFWQVNARIIADIFPIPHIEELVQKAAGKKLDSALDCFIAYNHIGVHLDSQKYTAFSTPDGHYEFLCMPFGLKTAVLVFNNTKSFTVYSSKEPFILTIGLSVLALGVTLSQSQQGHEQLIAAAGR